MLMYAANTFQLETGQMHCKILHKQFVAAYVCGKLCIWAETNMGQRHAIEAMLDMPTCQRIMEKL